MSSFLRFVALTKMSSKKLPVSVTLIFFRVPYCVELIGHQLGVYVPLTPPKSPDCANRRSRCR